MRGAGTTHKHTDSHAIVHLSQSGFASAPPALGAGSKPPLGQVVRPVLHEVAPAVEQVAAPVRGFQLPPGFVPQAAQADPPGASAKLRGGHRFRLLR